MGDLFHEHRLVGCFWSTCGLELQVVELWCVVVVIVGVVEGLAALVDVCLCCPCLAGGHGVAVAVAAVVMSGGERGSRSSSSRS